MSSKQVKIKINNLPLAAFADGHQLSVNMNTGEIDAIFFQINPAEVSNSEMASGIATSHIRLSLDQAKRLVEDILNNIESFEKSQK